MAVNIVTIEGRLARDPEVKQVGQSWLAKFTVATDYSYKGKDGNFVKEVSFIECTAWNKEAEVCKELSKGSPVVVIGRLKQEKWLDKESQKERSKLVIVCESVLPSIVPARSHSEEKVSNNESSVFVAPKTTKVNDFSFDDLPF